MERNVAPSTQIQALQALLFLYHWVLDQPMVGEINAVRAREHRRSPTVLTSSEVEAVSNRLSGLCHLIASLLYGSGLRVNECLLLRVKDIDFEGRGIVVQSDKGDKDRISMLPERIIHELQATMYHLPALGVNRQWTASCDSLLAMRS